MNALFEVSAREFLLVTILLGGGAAFMTGRAVALRWQGWATLVVYIALLAVAIRFIHFSLFGGSFFLPPATFGTALYYGLIDFVVLSAAGALGRQTTRSRQMATQYSFLYDRSGPTGWKRRA